MRMRIHRTTRRTRRRLALAVASVTISLLAAGALSQFGQAATPTPDQVGQWTAPIQWPLVAVHMAMQPDGKILMFDGFAAALNSERVWNPTTQAFTNVPYGRNLFCAGHVLLPDGRSLIVGGHVQADQGLADTTLFNDGTNQWVRAKDMTVARWYPTATQLPDGRVLVFAGDNIITDRPGQLPPLEDASVNSLPEIYDPAANTWQDLTSSQLTSPLYPFMFVLSDGRILDAGPDLTTRILTPGTWNWSSIGTSPFDGMSAVMYRPDKIMKSGSWADPDFSGAKLYNAQARTAVLDMSQTSPTWRETAPMGLARAYHNLTLLPDGTVFASGGSSQSDGINLSKGVLPAEIWNPDTETWTTVAPLQNAREYHSTALLLQDGRVLMAGGGADPSAGATDQTNAEIYSPPYLFKGPRPSMTSAPGTITYGNTFSIPTPDAANIASVSLIRTPSVTHAFDQNQRFMWLNYAVNGGSLTVTAPASAALAPPGDYLLYILNSSGVPSTGAIVKLTGTLDTTKPTVSITAPAQNATVSGKTVGVTANASDNDRVAGVTFEVDGQPIGSESPSAPFNVTWDTTVLANGTHTLTAVARDPTGNFTTSSSVTVTVSNTVQGPPPGLVAAYGFDEGSGTTVADQSGNGNNGTLANATWTTGGKYGSALSFNGTNAAVTIPDSASLDLATAMTLEAWVKPTTVTGATWRTVVFKQNTNYYAYALYASTGTNVPSGNIFAAGSDHDLRGPSGLSTTAWSHLAITYDGATMTLYVNGTQVSSVPAAGSIVTTTGQLKIGGNTIWGEWFNGLIDEVRVYNRALTAAQVQADMNQSISTPDSVAPSAPGTLTATGSLGSASLSWGAASDNVGVAKYDVYRSSTSGFTPSAANRIAQPTGLTYSDTGLAPGTWYYRVAAEDAAGNVGPPTAQASAVVTSDTTPPTVSISSPSSGATVSNTVSVGATASDNGTVAGVQFKLDGNNLGAEDTTAPYSVNWDTTTVANGSHTLTAAARDGAGNTATSSSVTVTVSNTAQPAGLVASYGFDEGTGTTVADKSGSGNNGTIANATWTTGGKYGSALSFNGTNAAVSIPDSASLDLTSAMTLEAWVKPTTVTGGVWRTVLFKENTNYYAYALYGSTGTNVPSGNGVIGGVDRDLRGTAGLSTSAWTHVAVTYDGTVLVLYVNGTQVSTLITSGALSTTNGVLKIGGNAVWGEWFNGLIDEVRVYNRALTASQIGTDMNTPITALDSTPPGTPGTLHATASINSVALDWGAATDNIGVARYDVYRSTTSGFTPSAANRIAQPTGLTYTDSGLAAGTYYYKVTAEDAAGNIGAPTNEATGAVTGDVSPPTAPGSLAASGSLGSVGLSWSAATDNVAVVKYDVYRSTTTGFTPSSANRIAQPTGLAYTDSGLAAGTYYYRVAAEDAAGNVGPPTAEASAVVTSDTTPPSVSITAPSAGATVSGTVAITANASDNGTVASVQFKVDNSNVGQPDTSSPYSVSWDTTGLANGTHTITALATDGAGNSAPSTSVSVTVANSAGLVAAYGMDAGSGTTLADQSGAGNNGTISNGTWLSSGKYGGALSFNGTNTSVSIPNSASLGLSSAMTLEAWVRPSVAGGGAWRTVVLKENGNNYAEALYANTGTNVPSANAVTGGVDHDQRGTSGGLTANVWTHLAATYDGSSLTLYVNGVQAGTQAASGAIVSSTGAVKIGGNAIWGEWFNGLIDEVRIYNRALTPAQITTDMNTSISAPDTQAPSAPGTLTGSGSLGSASLAWSAATDNVGIATYNVYRSSTSGFTPSAANRIAQPTGLSYTDNGLAAGTWYYRVTAQDAAGNVGPPTNELSVVVTSDTTPPTVSVSAPAAGATVSGTTTLSANAADNGSVASVQFKVDGTNVGSPDTTSPYSISWDSTSVANGAHTVTATATDGAGNPATSAGISITVSNTAQPSGLVASYGFDEGSGTATGDATPNGNNGTLTNGPTWTIGKHGRALLFDGVNDYVSVPDSSSLDLTNAMTLEAWALPTALGSTWRPAVFKVNGSDMSYSLYPARDTNVPNAQVFVGGEQLVNGTSAIPINQWSHVAATYDGLNIRLYVNGTLVGTKALTGAIQVSNGVLQIGGDTVFGEWFQGRLDDVLIYNRALSAGEIASDMNRDGAVDTTAPVVASRVPAAGATDVPVDSNISVTFNEALDPASVTTSSVELRDTGTNTVFPSTVSYDPLTATITINPNSAMIYGKTYSIVLHGGASGARIKDAVGNAPAADITSTFSTASAPPPVLVIGSTANKFSTYTTEMLKAEGMNEFASLDISLISPGILSFYDVAILGDMTLTSTQVTMLSNWVQAGGDLIAFHPDKQLAPLLGLTDQNAALTNAYMRVSTAQAPGAGIYAQTMQFHGSADLYSLNGATSVATLYTNASTATSSPAVTMRNVGANGGHAAAFAYDLARSVVYTRQGNPAWAGQERDGVAPTRPDDMFFGAKAGDVQPDWLDTSKISVPQADEQQRLLVNMIESMARPVPRYWYLPRMLKAALVLTGDDHAVGGTAGRFDQEIAQSPAGCSVALWQCIRSTSYIYPASPLTNAQAASYVAQGFEVALHVAPAGVNHLQCADFVPSNFDNIFTTQANAFFAKYTSVPPLATHRTHCVTWDDWATVPKVELAHGVTFDTNYYHYPDTWIGQKNGFMTGSGFPMKFADTDGSVIPVYQENTELTDESGQTYPAAAQVLFDGALGPNGFYGLFTANFHTDNAASPEQDATVTLAKANGVPMISAKQALDWTVARDASSFSNFTWAGKVLTFNATANANALGLQGMLPVSSTMGTLTGLSRGGSAVTYTVQTIKGIDYAIFSASTGTYTATYS
jgi:fibronectin type 3 domain-containing protein